MCVGVCVREGELVIVFGLIKSGSSNSNRPLRPPRVETFTEVISGQFEGRSSDQYRSSDTTALQRRSCTGDRAKHCVLSSKTIVPLCTLLEPLEHRDACKSAIFEH